MSGEAFAPQPILVLAPVGSEENLIGGRVPGSRHILAACGHKCWIAPSGYGYLAERKPRTLCIPCFRIEKPATAGISSAAGMREELIALGYPAAEVDALIWEMELTQG